MVKNMVLGNISSIETFGTVDGPGVRYVIFLQGCNLCCKYCHNRDTWDAKNIKIQKTPQEIFDDIIKYKNFIRKGGVTISGGEPMLQPEFCLELFRLLKKHNFHTALDTSGFIFNEKTKEILNYTDLVLLDIKSINSNIYEKLTSGKLQTTLDFLNYLKSINKPVWIRHVIIPTITDNDDDLRALAKYLENYRDIIKNVELLPYHTMGVVKWENMGIKYPLDGIEPLSKERLNNAKSIFKEFLN